MVIANENQLARLGLSPLSHKFDMSGAEAGLVLGVISSIIAIVDATKKVYDAATDTKGLPEAFREVAGRLPIVESILGSAKQNIEEKGVKNDSRKGVENTVKACKEKAEKLQELFNKVVPGEGASRMERYRMALKVPGKGHKVEKLMQGILEDVNLLMGEKSINSAGKAQQEQILKAIKEIAAVAPSVPEQEIQQTGFTNSNYGSGTQYNAQGENVAQGNAQLYNSAGGSMSFGRG